MSDEQRDALAAIRAIVDEYRYGNCTPDEYHIATPQNQAVWILQHLQKLGWQYVGPDQVVVSRADYLTIYNTWEFEIGHADGGFDHRDAGRDMDIHERMRESLGLPEPEPRLFHDDDDEVAF